MCIRDSVHAAARTGAGNGAGLERREVAVGHPAPRVRAHRLEHRHDVDVAFVETAGQNRAAVDEHRGPVQPRPVSYTHLDVYKRQSMVKTG